MVLSALLWMNSARPVIPAFALMAGSIPHFAAAVLWRVTARACRMPQHRVHIVEEAMYGYYQRYVLFVFETVSGVRIRLYGDVAACPADDTALYMCNHQSTVDWVVADMLAWRVCHDMGRIRFVLKDTLQYVPLFGWYFRMHGCVYVRRGTANFREANTRDELKFLAHRLCRTFWLVIYPEGTRLDPVSTSQLEASQSYSRQLERPPLRHVLCPRVTGVHLALQEQRQSLDALYDVTIAYSQARAPLDGHQLSAPSMFAFVCGKEGAVLHLHMQRIPIDQVPQQKDELHTWLHRRFEQKDEWLSRYYTAEFNDAVDDAFPDPCVDQRVTPLSATVAVAFCYGVLILPLFVSATARKVYAATWIGGGALAIAYMKLIDAA